MIWHVILQHSVQQGRLVMTVSMLLFGKHLQSLPFFAFSSKAGCLKQGELVCAPGLSTEGYSVY